MEVRWVLDDGRCLVAEGDGTLTAYSPDGLASRRFRLTAALEVVPAGEAHPGECRAAQP